MKYLILIQSNAAVADMFAAMTDEQRSAAYELYWSIESDLETSGELVEGLRRARPARHHPHRRRRHRRAAPRDDRGRQRFLPRRRDRPRTGP